MTKSSSSRPVVGPRSAPRQAAPDAQSTQERLLDAAERLFAERGFAGASLRALTQAAGTSVSAAHYHFGSKEELLRAALERRVAPLNAERLARLDAIESEAGPAGPTVEAILDAFLRPVFEQQRRNADASALARFVAARLYSDPPELVSAMKRDLFGETARRFYEALARALPGVEEAAVAIRFQLVVGAMVHVMSGNLEDAPPPIGGPHEARRVLDEMVTCFAAALAAGTGATR